MRKNINFREMTLGEALQDARTAELTVASVLREYYSYRKRVRALERIGAVVSDKVLCGQLTGGQIGVITNTPNERGGFAKSGQPARERTTFGNRAGSSTFVHLSSQWADDVIGTHDLRWFDLENSATDPDVAYAIANHRPILNRRLKTHLIPPFYDHAHYLCPLIMAYQAIQALGWAEHTSDWDWSVGLQTRDGVWHGDYTYVVDDPDYTYEPDEDEYEDNFEMFLPDGTTPLTPDNMPFTLTDDPFDYGDIIIAPSTGRESFRLRDIAIVVIEQR